MLTGNAPHHLKVLNKYPAINNRYQTCNTTEYLTLAAFAICLNQPMICFKPLLDPLFIGNKKPGSAHKHRITNAHRHTIIDNEH